MYHASTKRSELRNPQV